MKKKKKVNSLILFKSDCNGRLGNVMMAYATLYVSIITKKNIFFKYLTNNYLYFSIFPWEVNLSIN